MSIKQGKINITVDKSHLFTLGEKMYRESIEFVLMKKIRITDREAFDWQSKLLTDSL